MIRNSVNTFRKNKTVVRSRQGKEIAAPTDNFSSLSG